MSNDADAIDFGGLEPTGGIPADVRHEDGYFSSWDGADLYWQSWSPIDAAPSTCVALMHGYGEHSGRYHHVASALVRAGFAVMGMDARGHGRSVGKRGHVMMFDDYTKDFEKLVDQLTQRWEGAPTFVLGHSHGGLIALRHALRHDARIAGYVLSSPFCGFSFEVPALKALAGNVMSKIYPALGLPTGLDPKLVSHDTRVVEDYGQDPLNHSMATARWFTEVKAAQAETLMRAREITQPSLWLVAGADGLVDPKAAEAVYHALGTEEREFELFAELFHEILNEEPWPELVRRIVEWMRRHGVEAS